MLAGFLAGLETGDYTDALKLALPPAGYDFLGGSGRTGRDRPVAAAIVKNM